jgi:hypothetical protein
VCCHILTHFGYRQTLFCTQSALFAILRSLRCASKAHASMFLTLARAQFPKRQVCCPPRRFPCLPAEPFKHYSGIVPQLQNVVSTVNLGCQLDLASIAQRARNAEYNPKRFAACILRIREPKTTALMFNSGKVVIAGARSEEQSRLAARKVGWCSSTWPHIIANHDRPRSHSIAALFVHGELKRTMSHLRYQGLCWACDCDVG